MGWERMQPGCYSNRGWGSLCEKKYVLWWQNQMRLGGVVWCGGWVVVGWVDGGGSEVLQVGAGGGGDHHRGWQTQRLDVRPCAGWSELDEFAVSIHKLAFVMLFSVGSCVANGRWVRENPQSLSSSVSIQLCQHDSRSSFSACLSHLSLLLLLPSCVSAYTAVPLSLSFPTLLLIFTFF